MVVKVPVRLRDIIGRTKLKHPLHTADLAKANQLKWSHVQRFKEILGAAERARGTGDAIEAEALRLRLHAAEVGTQDHAHDRAEAIGAEQGYEVAKRFYDLATGQTTLLSHHSEAFLAHKADYRLATREDFKRVLRWLEDWCRTNHLAATLEAISGKTAGQFIDGSLIAGRSRAKAAAYLGFLREYWRWMQQRHHVHLNPWAGQPLPAAPRRSRDAEPDGGKRPFTDDEVATLIFGTVADFLRPPPSTYLQDLIYIAALSGMRLEEICQLRIGDCSGDSFRVREGKTENARREVPIHADLIAIVHRLSHVPDHDGHLQRRPVAAYLIDGLPETPASRDSRSDPASKAFTRYRRKVGVDERPNGKAKSNVDFHSFRRWFIAAAKARLEEGASGFSP